MRSTDCAFGAFAKLCPVSLAGKVDDPDDPIGPIYLIVLPRTTSPTWRSFIIGSSSSAPYSK
jgi:hypothetical protein